MLLALPTASLCYTTLMGGPPSVRPMLVISTLKISGLHYTYGCATLCAASICKLTFRIPGLHYTDKCPTLTTGYVSYLYLQTHSVTLPLWVRHLKCSLSLEGVPREILGYTSLMGVQP